MNRELAEHISLLAAPIYAALLMQVSSVDGLFVPAEILNTMREHAITQAHALWLQTLEIPD